MEVLEAGEIIGTLTAESKGLFWEISCKIKKNCEQMRRIFVQQGWKVEYLGIPDQNGELKGRIPRKHFPEGINAALATRYPKGRWLPWRGELDGVAVEEAYINPTETGVTIALPPEEAVKFPAWAEKMKTETIFGEEMAVLPLTEDGCLPVIDREMGGYTNEESDLGDADFELPADDAAGFCDSVLSGDEEQGRETDRPDL